jgi:LmbE family N-acetylglucosaminyl deacetylase
MLSLNIFSASEKTRNVLCLGAHCDDIEIGCGGTLLSLLESSPNIEVTWVLFTSDKQREKEAEDGAHLFTRNARQLNLQIFDFRDGFLPYSGGDVKQAFERLKQEIANPDLILTHYHKDLHQDHRLVSELTWNTFRNNLILEYEIPKWDGDFGTPNAFMPLTKEIGKQKLAYLQQAYTSQHSKAWFSDDLFWSTMRIRGMESNSPSDIAEAFFSRKLVLSP